MASFKDIFNGQQNTPGAVAVDDGDFAAQHPVLYQLMAVTVDDDGKKRNVSTVTIVCEQGQVKIGLNERDLMVSLWTSSASLGGAFTALEEALNERPVKWRKVQWRGKGKGG